MTKENKLKPQEKYIQCNCVQVFKLCPCLCDHINETRQKLIFGVIYFIPKLPGFDMFIVYIKLKLEHCSQCKQNAFRKNQYLDLKNLFGHLLRHITHYAISCAILSEKWLFFGSLHNK